MPACWQACRIVVPAATSISVPSIVTLGICQAACLCPRTAAVAVFGDAPLHLRAEMADQPLHRPHRAVGQRADRVALDLVGDVEQHVDLRDRGVAFDHALHDPPHPAAALAAWGALAAALVLVEFRQPRDRLHDVGRFVHHDDRGGAEPALHGDQAVEIHQHRLADRFRQDRHRGAAGDDRRADCPSRRARRRHGARSARASGCSSPLRHCTAGSHGRRCRRSWCRCCAAGRSRQTTPAPRLRIAGATAIVSTLLTVVGQP